MAEFDFEFFRNLYEDLQSPVLDNENSDCQFLSWDFNFRSVQVSGILKDFFSSKNVQLFCFIFCLFFNLILNFKDAFNMPSDRWKMQGNYTPWYFGWANCDEDAGKILRKYFERPNFLPTDSESGKRDWIFIGTPGFGAPMHLDNVKYPSWQAQVLCIVICYGIC